MFKLRKIIGGRTNVPEIQKVPAHRESRHIENSLEYLVNGMLFPNNIENKGTRYICIEGCSIGEKKTLPAYRVMPDMVFEATFNGNANVLLIGGKYTVDSNNSVTSTPGEDVILLDFREAKTKGTVMVSFI